MKVAVASGKGGTGKTLVSTSLAALVADAGHSATYIDADVEEPNGHLFLKPSIEKRTTYTVPVPVLANGRCSGCSACQQACAFNAIVALPDGVLLFPELCHSCGACLLACPERALVEEGRSLGIIERGVVSSPPRRSIGFCAGVLNVGEARATPLVSGVTRAVQEDGIIIVDSPPGTSCPVLQSVEGADLLLLVTEPTSFGLHDLLLAISMANALEVPFSVVINRANLGDAKTKRYLDARGIDVIAEIPFLPEVAEAYAHGRMGVDECRRLRELLTPVSKKLIDMSVVTS
jgi:MinD superfamily P-loop ATPase